MNGNTTKIESLFPRLLDHHTAHIGLARTMYVLSVYVYTPYIHVFTVSPILYVYCQLP
jgi:hypothetical protein